MVFWRDNVSVYIRFGGTFPNFKSHPQLGPLLGLACIYYRTGMLASLRASPYVHCTRTYDRIRILALHASSARPFGPRHIVREMAPLRLRILQCPYGIRDTGLAVRRAWVLHEYRMIKAEFIIYLIVHLAFTPHFQRNY